MYIKWVRPIYEKECPAYVNRAGPVAHLLLMLHLYSSPDINNKGVHTSAKYASYAFNFAVYIYNTEWPGSSFALVYNTDVTLNKTYRMPTMQTIQQEAKSRKYQGIFQAKSRGDTASSGKLV